MSTIDYCHSQTDHISKIPYVGLIIHQFKTYVNIVAIILLTIIDLSGKLLSQVERGLSRRRGNLTLLLSQDIQNKP